jgi:hypothetical protein
MRGRLFTVEQGYWPHGAVPFGYDKQYIEGNEVRMVVPRTKEFRKPRNWKLKLIVNEAEAKTVKWLFDEFAHKDTSMRQLGIELTKRGIPTPQGGMGRAGWTKQTVHDVLSNPAYCGDIAIGHHRRRQKKVFTRATPTIKKDAVPAIVDRETWKQVQLKFQKLQATARKAQPERSSSLSGVLVCGHCGYRMVKKERLGKVYYTCAGRFIRPGIKCSQWRAHEDELLPVICKLLVENIDFEILQKLQSKPSEQDTGQSERLQKQTAELEAKIRRGSENLLLATPELFPEMQRQVLEWKAELLKLQNTITLSESQTDEIKKWVTWWESVRGKLVVVSEMEWGNPQTLRQPVTLTRKEKADIIRKLGKKAGTVSVDGQTYELDSEGEIWRLRQVEEPVQPAIMAEPAVLRDLLHKLNCTVTLHWKPNGKRFFTLEKGILRAEFGEYYLDGRSNKCTHACTPDKD